MSIYLMYPIILIGNTQKTNTYIEDFIKSHHISSYNIISLNEKIKISHVREIQKKLFLKYEKGEKRLLILRNSITYDAQHALLKTLEEVPGNVYIIIVSQNREDFLPTILSRCKTISLRLNSEKENIEDVEKLKKILSEFLASDKKISNSIITTQKILEVSNRDDVLIHLHKTIFKLIHEEIEQEQKSERLAHLVALSYDLLSLTPLIKNNNVNIELALQQCLKSR